MGEDNAVPASKKRAAGREISRDNPGLDDEEDVSELETGTFKKASDEVIASRRIVKVRRQTTTSTTPAPSLNPFAGIRLVPPVRSETLNEMQADSVDKANSEADEKTHSNKEKEQANGDFEKEADAKPADEKAPETDDKESEAPETDDKESEEPKPVDEKAPETDDKESEELKPANDEDKSGGANGVNEDDKKEKKDDAGGEATSFSSFQQLSSNKNAFSGLAGSGFSSTTFSFGSSVSKDGSPSAPFSFGSSSNGGASLFGSTGNKSESTAFPSMQEIPIETGEENEETVFAADSALFEFLDGKWKECGKGEVKLNVSNTGSKKSRLVMRARGNYRLILNASLFPDMKLTKMDKKGITFACVNSATEGNSGLATFALKFKEVSRAETFSFFVEAYKGEVVAAVAAPALKTPENSPDAAQV